MLKVHESVSADPRRDIQGWVRVYRVEKGIEHTVEAIVPAVGSIPGLVRQMQGRMKRDLLGYQVCIAESHGDEHTPDKRLVEGDWAEAVSQLGGL